MLCACWVHFLSWIKYIYIPCLVPAERSTGPNTNDALTMTLPIWHWHVATKLFEEKNDEKSGCILLFMIPPTYYAPCFVLVENSVSYTICQRNQHKRIMILWEEDDVKHFYLVLNNSCWMTNKHLAIKKNYNVMVTLIWSHWLKFTFTVFEV